MKPPAAGPGQRPVAGTTLVAGTALITGASSGIGAATARELAARGWRPLLTGRDVDALAALVADIGGVAVPADLAEPEDRERLVGWALDQGPVDLLVCAAGRGWAGPYAETPADVLRAVLDVDLLAAAELVRAVLPGMLARGAGRLVLVSSIAGRLGVRDEAAYSAAKAGLHGLADALRHEVTGRGVTVTVVVPGVVDTAFFSRRGRPYDRRLPRPLPPERVAQALVEAALDGRAEIYVPRWLRIPARLHGAAPGLLRGLQRRFG